MTINIEDQGHNTEWAKSTLDLYLTAEDGLQPVENKEQLMEWLHRRQMPLIHFLDTPTYKNALESGNYPWLWDLQTPSTSLSGGQQEVE